MGDEHRTATLIVEPSNAFDLSLHRRVVVRNRLVLQALTHQRGLGVGQWIESDLAVTVSQQHGRDVGGRKPPDREPGFGQKTRTKAEPIGTVMVAGDEQNGRALAHHDPGERLVEQANGLGRRDRAVVDVAGDQHHIRALRTHEPDQLIEHVRLVFQE